MKKILFFDADGTIIVMDKGVPWSAKNAIKALTKQGHIAFLCTGRARSFVPSELEKMAFSGIIAGCGTYIEYNNKVLLDYEVPTELAFKSVHILRECGMVPVMEGTKYMYYDLDEYTDDVDWFASSITEQLGERHKPIRGNEHNMHISKISAKIRPNCDYKRAIQLLSPYYEQVQHRSGLAGGTIEFIAKGYSKGVAVKAISMALGFSNEDTIAFGDSNNDISMFAAANTNVAMSNAPKELLDMADFITDSAENDGIWNGLKRLQLI